MKSWVKNAIVAIVMVVVAFVINSDVPADKIKLTSLTVGDLTAIIIQVVSVVMAGVYTIKALLEVSSE